MTISRRVFLAVVCLCAPASAVEAAAAATAQTTTPALASIAAPYADRLRDAGITSVRVRADSTRVQVATKLGPIQFRYPAGLAPTAFVVRAEGAALTVDSDAYSAANAAQYEAAVKAVLLEAIRRTNDNNAFVRQRKIGV
jgi:hypothetical protein